MNSTGTYNFTDLLGNESGSNNDSLLNIYARHGEYEFELIFNPGKVWVDRAITPITYIIGFPGNIMALFIWMRRRMRHSSGCYLAALALSDLVFLFLHVFYELEVAWNIVVLRLPVLCEGYSVLYLMAQYLSPLLVLGFTVERYISICHPFKREKLCTTRRAVIVVVCLYIFAFGLCGIQAYFMTYDPVIDSCTVREEVTVGGTKSLWSVWAWVTEMLIFLVVPLMVLVFNVLVIREARRLSQKGARLAQGKGTKKGSATTVMLLAVSFYLIITTLPATITYAMFFSFIPTNNNLTDEELLADSTWTRYMTFMLIRSIIYEIGITHYACNFYIYFITGKQFRQEVKRVLFRGFLCRKCKKDKFGDYNSSARNSTWNKSTNYTALNGNGHQSSEQTTTPVDDPSQIRDITTSTIASSTTATTITPQSDTKV